MFRRLLVVGLVVGLLVGAAWWFLPRGGDDLAEVHDGIVADFISVPHISADDLQRMDPDQVVLFDVREPSEFAVSHLEGAIRVDPKIEADMFFAQHGSRLSGKTVVFYCAVGRRSSALAERVQTGMSEHGALAMYNLIGGLFQWRNENRPLVREGLKETRAVHPFNDYWGRLVMDRSAVQYAPAR